MTLAKTVSADRGGHEAISRAALAQRLADLLGYAFAGEYDPHRDYGSHVYFVPQETLLCARARRLGVREENDLYGGAVPRRFLATKAITHRAFGTRLPAGWPHALAARLEDAVLPGYTVFAAEDADRAARILLRDGPVRLKPAHEIGGAGQRVVEDTAALAPAIAVLDAQALTRHGAVVERNLEAASTLSIGEALAAGIRIAYFGVQQSTIDKHGNTVYGGSDLHVVRGGLFDLLDMDLPPAIRLAVEQACRYDAEIGRAFPRFFSSRRNYDVLQGHDARGRFLSGVLEQSWRIGGASPAEIAALAAFKAHAGLGSVRARCREIHSAIVPPPADADVHFRGRDPALGWMLKYSTVELEPRGLAPAA
ncbi:MAG TPA: DUF3182 family protein [Rudaea sp.]|nr:DUF3182 family protein [Rudaea sp.]